jgi:hypothetical protein
VLERKDLVLEFVAWVGDDNKRGALRQAAETIAIQKCSSRSYQLREIRSIPYSPGSLFDLKGDSVHVNSISADIQCDSIPEPARTAMETQPARAAMPEVVGSADVNGQPPSTIGIHFLSSAKAKCRDLGFKEKTEKFGRCVLELSK